MKKMLLAAAGAIAIAAPASAAPTVWAGNGHSYEYFGQSLNWDAARAFALAQGGYLVTITSAGENAFLAGLTSQLAWTGGSDAANEGSWIWVDGPEAGAAFSYTNWNGGEPNDFFGEDHMHFNWAASGGWNDYNGGNAHGFIVEFGGLGAGVPEPSAWALLILGFGAVGGALRRGRKVRSVLTYA